MSGYTPGPWQVWEGPAYVGGGSDLCIGAGSAWLANMDHRNCVRRMEHLDACVTESHTDVASLACDVEEDISTEQRANANLIAAAPDLLEALKRLMVEAGEGSARGRALDLLPEKTWRAAEAAIAKAEGRS